MHSLPHMKKSEVKKIHNLNSQRAMQMPVSPWASVRLTISGDSPAAVCRPDLSMPPDSLPKSAEGSPLQLCKADFSHKLHLSPKSGI